MLLTWVPDVQARWGRLIVRIVRPRRIGASIASAGIVAVVLSCSPDIEAPVRPPPIADYPDYSSPEKTLRTIALAIADQSATSGLSAYIGAFADSTDPGTPSYHQFFDPADVAFFEGTCQCAAPSDWRVQEERIFYAAFASVRPGDRYVAVFDSVAAYPDPPATDTQALLHRRYRVLAESPGGNSTLIIAIGYADLVFTRVSADRWLITRWTDHVDPAVGVSPVDPYQLTLGRRRLESIPIRAGPCATAGLR